MFQYKKNNPKFPINRKQDNYLMNIWTDTEKRSSM